MARAGLAGALGCALLLGLAPEGCRSAPDAVTPAAPAPPIDATPAAATPEGDPPDSFSGRRARTHLDALAELTPRTSGSRQAERARVYLRRELAGLGLEPQEWTAELVRPGAADARLVHVVADVAGRASADVFLLAATYTAPRAGAFEGGCEQASAAASGAALLLELARLLALEPLRYRTRLAFVDEGPPLASADIAAARVGGATLLRALRERGELEDVRLALFFRRVGEPGVTVARDLLSHRTYRERVFAAAGRLGRTATFPPQGALASTETLHRAFVDAGFRAVVALAGAPAVPPAGAAAPATDTASACSQDSLTAVGEVAWAGLADLADLLRKVDEVARPAPAAIAPAPDAGVTPQAGRE